jgi:electron transport complex protein RnfG
MQGIRQWLLAPALISAAACMLLAFTNGVPPAPVSGTAADSLVEALAAVLPEFDNDPRAATNTFSEDGVRWTFFVARKEGRFAGAAFVATSPHGYEGAIRVLVGVRADRTIKDIRVLSQQETPGVGSKVTEAPFRSQFAGRSIAGTPWKLRMDGGDIDAVTGATISSRAVTEAVGAGIVVYRRHAEEIAATGR